MRIHFRISLSLAVKIVDLSLILLCLLAIFKMADPAISGDGAVRYKALVNLADAHIPSIKFSLIQPICSLPIYKLAELLGAQPAEWVAYFNCIVFACLVLFILFYNWGADSETRVTSSMLLLAATMFPHHVHHYYGEVLSACLISMGLLSIRRNPLISFLSLGFGVANTPAILPAFAIAAIFIFYKTKRIIYLFFICLPIALFLIENLTKYGGLLPMQYMNALERGFKTVLPYSGLSGFSYPLLLGVLSILFSFGKGLLWFIPGLLLFGRKDIRQLIRNSAIEIETFLVFIVAIIFCYAKWWAWYGGNFWGPRFFLVACVPAAILMAHSIVHWRLLSRKSNMLVVTCFLLSAWGCAQGFIYEQQGLGICCQDNYAIEALCWYVPEFSPLWRQFVTGFNSEHGRQGFYFVSIAILSWLLLRSLFPSRTPKK